MAAKYSLQPDEAVLLRDERVMHGGPLSVYTDELILTNQNLVLLKKGMFGNSKGILVFPLNQVRVHDDRAQALIGTAANRSSVLEVYFLNGQETFNFQSGGKKKLSEWIATINYVVTGQAPPTKVAAGMALPGAELVAGVLKDTYGVFRSKLGPAAAVPQTVASKCRSCGAPLSGIQSQTVTCEYCGSGQQL